MRAAWAPSTLDNIMSQQELYLHFCNTFRLQPLPSTYSTLCMYAQFLSRDFKAPATVFNHLNGVKWLHFFHGYDVDNFDHYTLRIFKKGLARVKQYQPRQALPITPDILLDISSLVDWKCQQDVVYFTLFLFGFFLMARKSNLVPDSVAKFDPKKQLVRGDIQITKKEALVTLSWSKTNQFGSRVHSVPLLALPGSKLCPVRACSKLFKLTPGSDMDPVFQTWEKGVLKPITYHKMQKWLKKWIGLTGRISDGYTSHSLRRGGATFASKVGVPKEYIKLVGDWRSDCVDQYIQFPMEARVKAAQMVKVGLATQS